MDRERRRDGPESKDRQSLAWVRRREIQIRLLSGDRRPQAAPNATGLPRGPGTATNPPPSLGSAPRATLPNTTRGWSVGDPINNLTAEGNVPSWTAVRERFWKNEAHLNSGNYSADNLSRMQQGLAPQRVNPRTGQLESMKLHHGPPQRDGGLFDVQPVWPDDHAAY